MKILKLLPGGLALASVVSCGSQETQLQHPNVVYIFPDQYRGSALGFLSKEPYRSHINYTPDPVLTPNLDKIAASSAVLTNVVSNCPISSPHRGMLLTGCYPHESGIPLNCNASRPISSLRGNLTTISDVYASCGYDCAYIGKYHADFPLANDPQKPGQYVEARVPAWDAYTTAERRHGFDFWYSYGTFDDHKNPHYWTSNGSRHEPGVWSPTHEADVAIDYIKGHDRSKPFFMMIGFNPPHSAYSSWDDCCPEDRGMYEGVPLKDLLVRENADTVMSKAASCAKYYFTQVHGIDREVGRIYKALDDEGLLENTIFVFTSDHGETMCSHGLLDPKNSPYFESVNTPFILSYPARVKPQIGDWILSSPDIMPTLLGLSGLGDKVPASVQGRDLSGLFLHSSCDEPCDALYFQYLDGERDGEGLVRSVFDSARGIITERYTFAVYINRDGSLRETLLFDNAEDPYQMRNITPCECPSLVDSLLTLMYIRLGDIHDAWSENGTISRVKEQIFHKN